MIKLVLCLITSAYTAAFSVFELAHGRRKSFFAVSAAVIFSWFLFVKYLI